MAGKGGGAWKVAYADFVTAMMAFFMVMWITAQSKAAKEAIAEHFSSESSASFGWSLSRGNHPPLKVNDLQRKSIAANRPPESDSKSLRGKKRRFEDVSTVVPFAEGSSELDANAQAILERLAPQLAGKLQRIEIRGHNSRQGAAEGGRAPWDICYARCLATMTFLQEHCIAAERIRISLASGNEPPVDQSALADSSSRVEVLLLTEFVRPADETE